MDPRLTYEVRVRSARPARSSPPLGRPPKRRVRHPLDPLMSALGAVVALSLWIPILLPAYFALR